MGPASTQRHCFMDTHNLIVDQGMWVTGRLQTGNNSCSVEEWTSEIYTGESWIPGPQHPADSSPNPCLAEVNSTHSLLTGGVFSYKKVWLYDWTAGAWSETNQLNRRKWYHGCAVLEGQGVLVAGGRNGVNYVQSVELYDSETDIWTPQPSLPQDIFPYRPVLLSLPLGTVVAVFEGEDEVYQRADDGTWSAIEGVVLPAKYSGHGDPAALFPVDFADGYGCM